MDLKMQKRLAAEIMKVGISRVRVENKKEVEEAITREDVKKLIEKGIIKKVQKKGTGRVHAKALLKQKKRGRRSGKGSRKGKKYSKITKKEQWMKSVRALRKLLKELRDKGKLEKKDYRMLYRKVKGGSFRSKKHLMMFIKDNELLKAGSKEKKG
ncbi:MAG TPA: 50S ribosomal protein L19e [Candidatus Aenigmarchaeota archaeon]|nr:MAG: 50S ribosomal protein L19e [Candidatus Aenigmarchaeota archaeon]HDD46393.1 50S ribosomal protein L19e [Candidatus Aenigmarchaeota archaeon]